MFPTVLRRTECSHVALAPDDTLMVYIPRGDYGGLGGDQPNEVRPIHGAKVTGYWISSYPVTIASYAHYVARKGHEPGAHSDRKADALLAALAERHDRGQRFAVGLTYFEANSYARAFGLRIPNETEWEIAMRMSPPPGDDSRLRGKTIDQRFTRPPGVGLSPLGCAVLVNQFGEWTSDLYGRYLGDVRDIIAWQPPRVERDNQMSVRGQASQLRPSPILRQHLEAHKTGTLTLEVGFRCAVTARDVVFQDA